MTDIDQAEKALIIATSHVLDFSVYVPYTTEHMDLIQKRVVQLNDAWINFLHSRAEVPSQTDMFGGG